MKRRHHYTVTEQSLVPKHRISAYEQSEPRLLCDLRILCAVTLLLLLVYIYTTYHSLLPKLDIRVRVVYETYLFRLNTSNSKSGTPGIFIINPEGAPLHDLLRLLCT